MIELGTRTLLVVAPHPDDEVIGCGGLVAKVKEAGGAVYVMYLTVGVTQDFSKKGNSSVDERTAEIERVAQHFDLDGWRIVYEGDQHHLRLDALPQRKLIHELERGETISLEAVRPDIIAFTQFGDYNQDHRAAAEAVYAACRPAPRDDKWVPDLMLQAESPMIGAGHQYDAQHPTVVFELSEEQLQKKITGMSLYESQVRAPGHTRNEETLKALAQVRGSLVGAAYGEAYHGSRLRIK